jgi:hypothetical protein
VVGHTAIRAAAIVLGAALVGGCGGGQDSHSAGTATARPATAPAAAGTAFDDYQDLESGRTYTTTAFKPAVRFVVPAGAWGSETGDTVPSFSVALHHPPKGISQALLGIHRIDRVFDPHRGGSTPGDLVALRGSFAAWLQKHPRLKVTAPRKVSLLGLDGVQLDITGASQPPKVPDECAEIGDDCVPLFSDGLDEISYANVARGRFTVLKLRDGGELVVEEFVEPKRSFARGLRLLRPLLRQMRLAAS